MVHEDSEGGSKPTCLLGFGGGTQSLTACLCYAYSEEGNSTVNHSQNRPWILFKMESGQNKTLLSISTLRLSVNWLQVKPDPAPVF